MSLKDVGWECPKCGTIYAPHVPSCMKEHKPKTQDAVDDEQIPLITKFDEMSDEEVLYWATPYYDELQAVKAKRDEQLKLGEDLNEDVR